MSALISMTATVPAADGWPAVASIECSEQRWWVLRTCSRQEKAVAGMLGARGISYFLPLVRAERFHGARRQQVELPLFPGYVFLHGDRDATFEIDRTRRIADILPVDDQRQLHRELENLQLAIQLQAGFDPYPYLPSGSWAEVTSGPYKGIQGRVDRESSPDKLILQVDLLESAMSIEVDGAMLTPIRRE